MTEADPVVAAASRTWRRLGVPRDVRSELAHELSVDLAAALSDGRQVETVVGPDVARFATEWALARGDVPLRADYLRCVVIGWLGLLAGGSAGAGVLAVVGFAAEFFRSSGRGLDIADGGWVILAPYFVAGLGSYLGALAITGLDLQRRNDPFARRTVGRLAPSLAVAVAAAVGLDVGLAAALNYPLRNDFVILEILLAVVVVSAGVAVARRAAVGSRSARAASLA